jgi:uncharacterized integral membrane protein
MTDASSSAREPRRSSNFLGRHALAIILLVLAIIFIAENTRKVKIRALGPTVTAPLWLAFVVTLAAGMLIAVLASRRRSRR